MRAVVTRQAGKPGLSSIEEVAVPDPGQGEVLVEVAACGICGHDQADRFGLTAIGFPVILGHEIAGTVAKVGDGVESFRAGDRVAAKQFTTCGSCEPCGSGRELDCKFRSFNYGGYAEFVTLAATALIAVPPHVDLVAASVVACTVGATLQALRDVAQVQRGEQVLVVGAGGGLGIHGVQVARALGARVIALTRSESKKSALASYADEVVVATGSSFWEQIVEITHGGGADVVLDNVGHPDVFSSAFRSLRKRGRYVMTGQVAREKIAFFPYFLFQREVVLTGSSSTLLSSFRDAMDLVARGVVSPVVRCCALERANDAFEVTDAMESVGRLVLVP